MTKTAEQTRWRNYQTVANGLTFVVMRDGKSKATLCNGLADYLERWEATIKEAEDAESVTTMTHTTPTADADQTTCGKSAGHCRLVSERPTCKPCKETPKVRWSENHAHVVAMQLSDGRVGVACGICRRGWLTKTRDDARAQARSHRNNVCELALLLPLGT